MNGQAISRGRQKTEREQLLELLHLFSGNRGKVAKEMGISTTTLWRRMKKYGLTE